jgi:hypothetical protein
MNTQPAHINRPILKSRGFSLLHIEIFEQILNQKTNQELNQLYGYTKRSHTIVDHSRKVMFKLLALENYSKKDHNLHIVYPRDYCFWWKKLLDKHRAELTSKAIKPEFYAMN